MALPLVLGILLVAVVLWFVAEVAMSILGIGRQL
jgi:hypothetical protein